MRVTAPLAGGLVLGTALYAAGARRVPHPERPLPERRRVLAAATVSAAVEELLWRGAALRLLGRRRPRLVLGATSVAFAASHLPHARGRALLIHLLLGLACGGAARRSGLVAAAAAHATYDVLVLLEPAPT